MTPTPVGMRCPECSKQKQQVHTLRGGGEEPILTWALLAINILAFFGSKGGSLFASGGTQTYYDLSLFPIAVSEEWWRLLSSGFLHVNALHLFFNMYMLYILGPSLESTLGKGRFIALYLASVLGGSFLVVLFSSFPGDLASLLRASPTGGTVGASGAIFGLFGGAYMYYRARGETMMTAYLGPTILMNLAFTVIIPFISLGGHLGGLIVGGVIGMFYWTAGKRRLPAIAQIGLVCALAVALLGAAVIVAPGVA